MAAQPHLNRTILVLAALALALTGASAPVFSTPSSPDGVPVPTVPRVEKVEITPDAVTCTLGGCDKRVTVKNEGTDPILIAIEFDGPAQPSFQDNGTCVRARINPNGECTFDVLYRPTAPGGRETAALVIHQSPSGADTVIALIGSP